MLERRCGSAVAAAEKEMRDECHVHGSEEDEVSDVAHKVDEPNVEEGDGILHIGEGQRLELFQTHMTRHDTRRDVSAVAKQRLE
jgi:hypothetical protein